MFRISKYVRERRARQIEKNRAVALAELKAAMARGDTRDQHKAEKVAQKLTHRALEVEVGR